jgi:hypothetical protein
MGHRLFQRDQHLDQKKQKAQEKRASKMILFVCLFHQMLVECIVIYLAGKKLEGDQSITNTFHVAPLALWGSTASSRAISRPVDPAASDPRRVATSATV